MSPVLSAAAAGTGELESIGTPTLWAVTLAAVVAGDGPSRRAARVELAQVLRQE